MTCEKCWGDAYMLSLVDGRSQVEHYRELLIERSANPCTQAEQEGRDLQGILDAVSTRGGTKGERE